MTKQHYTSILLVVAGTITAVALPFLAAGQIVDTRQIQADIDERMKEMQENIDRAREHASQASSRAGESASSAVSNEIRVESNNGSSRVRVQTTINGQTVEDIDETVEDGAIEKNISVEQDGAQVETRVRASATGGGVDSSASAGGHATPRTSATSVQETLDERRDVVEQRQQRLQERIEERRADIQERQIQMRERVEERMDAVRQRQEELQQQRAEREVRAILDGWVSGTFIGFPIPVQPFRFDQGADTASSVETQTIAIGTTTAIAPRTVSSATSSLSLQSRITSIIQRYVFNM